MLLHHWIRSIRIFVSASYIPITHAAIIYTDFISAIAVDVCHELDGGYGPGRVAFDTNSCQCEGLNKFTALCRRIRPNPRELHMQDYTRDCDPRDPTVVCLPTEDKDQEDDCSCIRPPKKLGSKPPHTTEDIICTQPVTAHWPDSIMAVDVYSTIVTVKADRPHIQGCYAESTRGRTLHTHYPCGSAVDNGNVVALANGNDYRGCIEADEDTLGRINFEWVLQSPWGHAKRDENGHNYDLRDVLHFGFAPASADSKCRGSVVLLDENGEELKRWGP